MCGSLQANDAQQRLVIDERHELGDAELTAQARKGFLEHALMDPTDHLTMFSGNDLEWTTVKLDFVLTRRSVWREAKLVHYVYDLIDRIHCVVWLGNLQDMTPATTRLSGCP
jgi:hypothetical protein